MTGVASNVRTENATVVIIGAGQSGLAMSHCLTSRGIDPVLLERGQVANSWKNERWDSLRLLTPNWQCTLPGLAYSGDEPDNFMPVADLTGFLDRYAEHIDAPIRTDTSVTDVSAGNGGYSLQTSQGPIRARAVVLASGGFNKPKIPACASGVPGHIHQVTPMNYHNPDQLPDGGVLVVGTSATGLQLSEEIHASGRLVTLAVGEHVRMPRRYRDRDIQWWMDGSGLLDERWDEVDDLTRARGVPSPQLVGSPEGRTLDLNTLSDLGVRLTGRLAMVHDGVAMFSGSLQNTCALADLKMNRMLNTIDGWASDNGLNDVGTPERYAATRLPSDPLLKLDLNKGEIATIVWATGYNPDYSWLNVPVVDRKGRLKHDGGVVDAPGMYALGLTFLRRRKSSFIHGAQDDAQDMATHLADYLAG
ncbi:MAG: NAD(P)-binding domain-containing protein [Proteobacteria bacterium]|nr:NAD(P)-binding domain-containing protein [Pseudomonadota bacterium]